MKHGFRIVYHNSITPDAELISFLEKQKAQFCSDDSYKCRQDSGAFYRRGLFGLGLNANFKWNGDIVYTFKRLSKNRRIFGLVPISELIAKSPPLKLDQCMCAVHRGGQRVILRTPYDEQNYVTFYETGDIKG